MKNFKPLPLPFSPSGAYNLIRSETGLSESDIVTVFVGGSFPEGFANRNSDIDLYCVARLEGVAKYCFESDSGAEVIPISMKTIEDLADGLLKSFNSRASLSRPDKLLIQRILYGQPLYAPEEFEKVRAKFDSQMYLKCLSYELSKECINNLVDILGASASGDMYTAIYQCDQLLDLAMDLYLTLSGEGNHNGKWRLHRALRTLGSDDPMFVWYLALSSRAKELSSTSLQEQYIEPTIRFYQAVEEAYVKWRLC